MQPVVNRPVAPDLVTGANPNINNQQNNSQMNNQMNSDTIDVGGPVDPATPISNEAQPMQSASPTQPGNQVGPDKLDQKIKSIVDNNETNQVTVKATPTGYDVQPLNNQNMQ